MLRGRGNGDILLMNEPMDNAEHVARLGGKTAVVTGAGSGIGRAIALLFARAGAHVLCADVAEEMADATASLITEARGTAEAAVCDVRDEQQVAQLIHTAVDHFGALDVLVNNAGINPLAPTADDIDPALWSRILEVNLAGIFWGCKHGAAAMREREQGSIVNLASVSGLIGWGGSAAYVASKGGVIALTRKLAIDYAPHGIRVNCLCPGSIRTPMVEQNLSIYPDAEERLQQTIDQHPLGRIGTPEDVAFGALYLACDESSFVTGTALVIDGGLTAV